MQEDGGPETILLYEMQQPWTMIPFSMIKTTDKHIGDPKIDYSVFRSALKLKNNGVQLDLDEDTILPNEFFGNEKKELLAGYEIIGKDKNGYWIQTNIEIVKKFQFRKRNYLIPHTTKVLLRIEKIKENQAYILVFANRKTARDITNRLSLQLNKKMKILINKVIQKLKIMCE